MTTASYQPASSIRAKSNSIAFHILPHQAAPRPIGTHEITSRSVSPHLSFRSTQQRVRYGARIIRGIASGLISRASERQMTGAAGAQLLCQFRSGRGGARARNRNPEICKRRATPDIGGAASSPETASSTRKSVAILD